MESGLSAKLFVPNTSELDLTTVQKLNYAIGQLFLRALAPTITGPRSKLDGSHDGDELPVGRDPSVLI